MDDGRLIIPGVRPRAGDVFAVQGQGFISACIRTVERINSHDNEAFFGHAGIFLDENTILDTLWTVQRTTLDLYRGQRMVIARPTRTLYGDRISPEALKRSVEDIERAEIGWRYPVHRIPLHLIPPIAKFLSAGRQRVCSERTALHLVRTGARNMPWAGATPDMLADEWDKWRNIDVLFLGKVPLSSSSTTCSTTR